MKQKIRLFFTDFWPGFSHYDNFFYNFLSQHYDVGLTADNPDYLIYSTFGNDFRMFNAVRIFFTGENIRPNFRNCDYSFSFDFDTYSGKNYRLPHYVQYANPELLLSKPPIEIILREKTKFCNFIYSNPNCKIRNDFFRKLSKYKKVDSGGKVFNNIGNYVGNKLKFIKDYKFTIAFENESYRGYTTEKIFEPMLVNSLPIYWGNELIQLDFNTRSFLNYYEFKNLEALVEKVIELDNDDEKYAEYYSQPYFTGNKINEYVDYGRLLQRFEFIFSNKINPVSSRKKFINVNNKYRSVYQRWIKLSFKILKFRRKIKNFRLYKLKMYFDSRKFKKNV